MRDTADLSSILRKVKRLDAFQVVLLASAREIALTLASIHGLAEENDFS
jgi:hypothetical protein